MVTRIRGEQIWEDYAGAGLTVASGVMNVVTSSGILVENDTIVVDPNIAGTGLIYTDGVLSTVTVSGIETLLELTDVYIVDYEANNMLYTSISGVHDTPDMTYDPATGNISLGNTSDTSIVIDQAGNYVATGAGNQTKTHIGYNDITMGSMVDSGPNGDGSFTRLNFTEGGGYDDYFDLTLNSGRQFYADVTGITLVSGTNVNNIGTSIIEVGSHNKLVTEQAIIEYVTSEIATASGSAVTDDDFQFEDQSANCGGGTVVFNLNYTPIANTLQAHLNGLMQQLGVGKDYTLSSSAVTFNNAPHNNDTLLFNYVTS